MSDNFYEHQDHKIINIGNPKLKKELNQVKSIVQKFDAGKNSNNRPNINSSKLENEEFPEVKKPSKSMGQNIQKARLAKKWSRKDLANQCNLQETLLADYENGKVIIPGNHKSLISKKLGIPSLK